MKEIIKTQEGVEVKLKLIKKELRKEERRINSLISSISDDDERIIITTIEDYDQNLFEQEVYNITGVYPTPCDVNINDWFIYYNDIIINPNKQNKNILY
jgi:predicted aldo/keto reductase-like oxidoreductase